MKLKPELGGTADRKTLNLAIQDLSILYLVESRRVRKTAGRLHSRTRIHWRPIRGPVQILDLQSLAHARSPYLSFVLVTQETSPNRNEMVSALFVRREFYSTNRVTISERDHLNTPAPHTFDQPSAQLDLLTHNRKATDEQYSIAQRK
jgi:hypothetical protein